MKVNIGVEGLDKTFQAKFPEQTTCVHCHCTARIGFVAHELNHKGKDSDADLPPVYVCQINEQKKDGKLWLHDLCAVAVYFCEKCLNPTALYNQG